MVDFQAGDLLIATVSLVDPNFQQTVVLLCAHDDDEGSYGLVLNRPISAPAELQEDYPFVAGRLFHGGPVQQDAMQMLHSFGEELSGARQVLPDLWIGGSFEILQAGLKSGVLTAEECRFFLGYAGWGRGQLAREFGAEAWIKVSATRELILSEEAEQLWARAVRKRGIEEPMYTNFPDHPNLN